MIIGTYLPINYMYRIVFKMERHFQSFKMDLCVIARKLANSLWPPKTNLLARLFFGGLRRHFFWSMIGRKELKLELTCEWLVILKELFQHLLE